MSDRFEYAKWRLTEKGDPEALRKERARLEQTSAGKQLVEAQDLLKAHDERTGDVDSLSPTS